ncbi:hypothetical protein FRC11_007284 [Ceratobasidium sp. 423]|nr:hypothetical protein FRC11_007284 [Ceratobasidium sp. 423]
MSQANPTKEKCMPKDTPGIAQHRAEVKALKKQKEKKEQKKNLKSQGTGSTIPTSCKAAKEDEPISSDNEYDPIAAEIRAEEACVNALRAKVVKQDGLWYKDLCQMDEDKLQ